MEKIQWKVEGMTCANCALTVNKYLKTKGAENVTVSALDGAVSFEIEKKESMQELAKGIHDLGYSVKADTPVAESGKKRFLTNHWQRFLFCAPFTLILFLSMIPALHLHVAMDPSVQLALTLPVFIVGMSFFGRSAIKSIRNGIPNMNVLIAIGALASFVYSLAGLLFHLGPDYIFFETTATIITLVFLGNYLEDASMQSTQRALRELTRHEKVMANMIAFDDEHKELIFPVENTQLKNGDLVLIRTGEEVPADCKILWGEAEVNEALLTGESLPLTKKPKDTIIGGSVLVSGLVKAQVTAAGADTVLSSIINLVKKAQGEKPPVQQLADKISAIFVPVVLGIAALTLLVNWLLLHAFTPALLRSIAVLVIACPCAMGLATPAAIAVGLGRAARNGILFRNAKTLELFKDIRQVVFDKTGTLTTGQFRISAFHFMGIEETRFRQVVFSIEKHSNHPLAKAITTEWKGAGAIPLKTVSEIKGQGVAAEDRKGNSYKLGSYAFVGGQDNDEGHNIYLSLNNQLVGWIDLADQIRPEARAVVQYLRQQNIKTILLSGDRHARVMELSNELGIDQAMAEKSPEAKLQAIRALSATAPTVMIGDGINDAPALAEATIGISMSDASQLAVQSAQVVLVNSGLQKLPTALGLGRHTYLTIQQNLFWAFIYNIVAIPVAAFGLLSPTFAALVMAFSDIVLAVNSARLYVKKVA